MLFEVHSLQSPNTSSYYLNLIFLPLSQSQKSFKTLLRKFRYLSLASKSFPINIYLNCSDFLNKNQILINIGLKNFDNAHTNSVAMSESRTYNPDDRIPYLALSPPSFTFSCSLLSSKLYKSDIT